MLKEKLKQVWKVLSESKEGLRKLVRNCFIIVIGLWIMFAFVIGVDTVQSYDMSPALNLGDRLIYSRFDKDPIARDVIVFKKDGEMRVSRVIAIPGDTVEITPEGSLIVNGNYIMEDRISGPTYPYTEYVQYPITLAKNEYFVLGDNRRTGVDSRYYGTVKEDEILGTLIMVIRQHNF